MFDNNLGYDPVLLPRRSKNLHADGTITIICRICERPINRQQYQGFSTAICAVCHGELEKGRRPEEIMADVRAQEKVQSDALYNDIGGSRFRAHGFGKRIKEIIDEVRVAATKRRRGALFSKKDSTPVK